MDAQRFSWQPKPSLPIVMIPAWNVQHGNRRVRVAELISFPGFTPVPSGLISAKGFIGPYRDDLTLNHYRLSTYHTFILPNLI